MEISTETKEKFSKSAETIYKQGWNDRASSKKNQSEVEKELVRNAENVAKRITANKNIPDEKKMRTALSGCLSEITRDGLLKVANDALALRSNMPKPAPKPKPQPGQTN